MIALLYRNQITGNEIIIHADVSLPLNYFENRAWSWDVEVLGYWPHLAAA